jgi:hypothetical protein
MYIKETNNNSSSGIGFIGGLTLLLIGLKLTGVIDWSWWWVLSPLITIASLSFIGIAIFLYPLFKVK